MNKSIFQLFFFFILVFFSSLLIAQEGQDNTLPPWHRQINQLSADFSAGKPFDFNQFKNIIDTLPYSKQKKAASIILTAYFKEHLEQGRLGIVKLDEFFNNFYDNQQKSAIIYNSLVLGYSNSLLDKWAQDLERRLSSFDDQQSSDIHFSLLLYQAIRFKKKEEWEKSIMAFKKAWEYKVIFRWLDDYALVLEKGGKSGQALEIAILSFLERGDEAAKNLWQLIGLYYQKQLFNQSFMDYFRKSAGILKKELKRLAPDLPENKEAVFTLINEKGQNVLIDFKNKESMVYKKKALFAFFSTKCGYCRKELLYLSDWIKARQLQDQLLLLAINTNIHHKYEFYAKAGLFQAEIQRNLDIYADFSRPNIVFQYRIASVPKLLYFDSRGNLKQIIVFNRYENLDFKLNLLLNDIINSSDDTNEETYD